MTSHHPDRARTARMRWITLGLAFLSLAAAAGLVREVMRGRQIEREIAGLRAEAESLRARNFEIASLHASLASGDYVEREARLKLNLQKEGERVVVIRKDEAEAAEGEGATPTKAEWSNPKKWWTYFTDRNALDAYARSRGTNP